jgi:hypothetical protein
MPQKSNAPGTSDQRTSVPQEQDDELEMATDDEDFDDDDEDLEDDTDSEEEEVGE